jgi:hypothetical protein
MVTRCRCRLRRRVVAGSSGQISENAWLAACSRPGQDRPAQPHKRWGRREDRLDAIYSKEVAIGRRCSSFGADSSGCGERGRTQGFDA